MLDNLSLWIFLFCFPPGTWSKQVAILFCALFFGSFNTWPIKISLPPILLE